MRPNPLIPTPPLFPKHPNIRILDNLQLMLLLPSIKVLVERGGRQLDRLGDQASEVERDLAHLLHVRREYSPKFRQHIRRRPLVRREQVVVQRGVLSRERMVGRQVDLLAVVCGAGCYFG